ncbi:hypothetical protein [Leptolyngbya sp. NIES-2104]|uniref:hypothetical protein n=1 Tax=Leptolyngbya sp. NIES-2104 TaxID=1552121 RepID=UPI0006EC6C0D|nr:hypothetical protein [Leptolyngbya sp. NIES-2104]GAP97028.1 hypothetical protein NIES2104_35750 [Leptolyngbya sp. NIES-2104]
MKSHQRTELIEIAKKLLVYKILTEQDYQILMDQINQGNVSDRASLLDVMSRQAERRLNPDLPQQAFTEYVFVGELGEAEVNRLKSIAKQLKEAGAISDRIQAILERFEAISLLPHLTPQQKAKGKQKIARQYINSSYELLAAFDDLMISFDWETGNLENPYQALTERFASASRGAFNPTQISDGFDLDKGVAGLSFFVNGVRYSTKLKFDGDWLDPEFMTLIDRAVAETVSDGKFYELYDGSSVEGYLFLTSQQRQALEAENLVKLAPEK